MNPHFFTAPFLMGSRFNGFNVGRFFDSCLNYFDNHYLIYEIPTAYDDEWRCGV